jgi:hypothetical protein
MTIQLGNPQIEAAQGAAAAAVKAEAGRAARNVLPIICEIQKFGSKKRRARSTGIIAIHSTACWSPIASTAILRS